LIVPLGADVSRALSVPPGALAVSGGQQRNIEDWVQRKRPGSAAADAAEKAKQALDADQTP